MKKSLIALAALCAAAFSFAATSPPASIAINGASAEKVAVHAELRVQADHDKQLAGVAVVKTAAPMVCMPTMSTEPVEGLLHVVHRPRDALMRDARGPVKWHRDTGQTLRQT